MATDAFVNNILTAIDLFCDTYRIPDTDFALIYLSLYICLSISIK